MNYKPAFLLLAIIPGMPAMAEEKEEVHRGEDMLITHHISFFPIQQLRLPVLK